MSRSTRPSRSSRVRRSTPRVAAGRRRRATRDAGERQTAAAPTQEAPHGPLSSDRAPDVVGPEEATALLNVNRSRFYQLRARPDFPAGRELACGTVYDRRAILAYHLSRQTPPADAPRAQVYRETGTIAAAARAVDRDPSPSAAGSASSRSHCRVTAARRRSRPRSPGSTAAILQARVRRAEEQLEIAEIEHLVHGDDL
jgi:hypothetical protein